MTKIAIDLGCGQLVKNPFNADIVYGIDVREDLNKNIIKADLVVEKIPFENELFDFVTAHDLADSSTKCNTG